MKDLRVSYEIVKNGKTIHKGHVPIAIEYRNERYYIVFEEPIPWEEGCLWFMGWPIEVLRELWKIYR